MTKRLDALEACLAKVEAGIEPNQDEFRNALGWRYKDQRHQRAVKAFMGSMDSAMALHEAVLPECRARIDLGRRFRAWVITDQNVKFDAYSSNPARAWLIAILKTLISEATQ